MQLRLVKSKKDKVKLNLITFIKRKIKSLFKEDSVKKSSHRPTNRKQTDNNKNAKKEGENYKSKQPYRNRRHIGSTQHSIQKKTIYTKPKQHNKRILVKLPTLIDISPKEGELRFTDFPLKKEILCKH